MRESQSFIGQSVGHHIVLAINVIHSPMNTALSEGVTERNASSKVWPQVGRAASSLPAAEDDHLARKNLGVQLEDSAYRYVPGVAPAPCCVGGPRFPWKLTPPSFEN